MCIVWAPSFLTQLRKTGEGIPVVFERSLPWNGLSAPSACAVSSFL